MSDVRLSESTPLVEAVAGSPTKRRFRARLIEGDVQGSSGFYPSAMLRADGPRIFKAGTRVFADHPTATESVDRPERSIKDLAGRLATDAVYDRDGLYAEVEVFPHYAPVIEGMADAIGMSIRAFGTAEPSSDDTIRGPIITALTEGISVDFVTAAGAGGKLVELLESARASAPPRLVQEAGRNVGAWIESRIHAQFTVRADEMYGSGRLSRQERIGLSSAIGDALDTFVAKVEADLPQLYTRDLWDGPPEDGDAEVSEARRLVAEAHGMTARDLDATLAEAVRAAHGGKDRFAWTRDYTDDWVVYSVETDTGSGLYQQTYAVTNGAVTLTGQPTEVRAHTTYTPAGQPQPATEATEATKNAPGTEPADETKEGLVPEITEDQARQLEEAATVKAELDAAKARLAEAEQRATDAATNLAEAGRIVDDRFEQLTRRLDEAEDRAAKFEERNRRLETERIARNHITEKLRTSGLPARAQARITESVTRALPYGDDGGLDNEALAEAVQAAVEDERSYLAEITESAGAGTPRGLGSAGDRRELDEAAIDEGLRKAFEGLGLSESDASTAAFGR